MGLNNAGMQANVCVRLCARQCVCVFLLLYVSLCVSEQQERDLEADFQFL